MYKTLVNLGVTVYFFIYFRYFFYRLTPTLFGEQPGACAMRRHDAVPPTKNRYASVTPEAVTFRDARPQRFCRVFGVDLGRKCYGCSFLHISLGVLEVVVRVKHNTFINFPK